MPPANRPPAAPGADVPERILGVRKLGGGQQFEVQWAGRRETTWEAVSRMRRQFPQMVQAFEQQPAEGTADSDEPMSAGEVAALSAEGAAPADNASLQRQVAELAQLVKQQAQRA